MLIALAIKFKFFYIFINVDALSGYTPVPHGFFGEILMGH